MAPLRAAERATIPALGPALERVAQCALGRLRISPGGDPPSASRARRRAARGRRDRSALSAELVGAQTQQGAELAGASERVGDQLARGDRDRGPQLALDLGAEHRAVEWGVESSAASSCRRDWSAAETSIRRMVISVLVAVSGVVIFHLACAVSALKRGGRSVRECMVPPGAHKRNMDH